MASARAGLPESDVNASAFAAALLDPALPCPPGFVTWNGSDPARRFAVYRNNVIVSLVDALAETFPVVQALVGPEFFRAMAASFVRQTPPHAPALAHYGLGLAAFIEGFEPARPLPYLPDMARLEHARVRAYHAADAECVSAEVLRQALARPERLAALRLVCHPSVQVVRSCHAVVSLWAAHQLDGADLPDPHAGPEAALVLRDGLDVLVLPVDERVAAFVGALLQGKPLAEAAAGAPGADLPQALGMLARHGALGSVHWHEEEARS
jgi:hypothetical protein